MTTLKRFHIWSRAGADFGIWEAIDAEAAFAAMVTDSGSDNLDDNDQWLVGTINDWHVIEEEDTET